MEKLNTQEIETEGDTDRGTDKCRPGRCLRQKVLYSICIYITFALIGWNRGLFGPSFPDIQHICQVNLEMGSWIPTTFFIGYTVGSLAGGFLERYNLKLIFGLSLVLFTLSVIVTPWCVVFEAMLVAHLGQGFCQGIVDTIGNSEILLIWKEKRLMFYLLELMFTIGGFISPLLVAPFLMDIPANMHIPINVTTEPYLPFGYNESLNDSFVDQLHYINFDFNNKTNVSSTMPSKDVAFRSMIYIPYCVTAFLIFCTSIAFFVMYFVGRQEKRNITMLNDNVELEDRLGPIATNKEMAKPKRIYRKLPAFIKLCCLATASGFFMFYVGIGETFSSYLTVFCVNYLSWTPADGALLAAITNICSIIAIVMSLFLTRVNVLVYGGVNSVFVFLSFLGMLISSIYYYEIGMWISCCVHGLFRAMVFSLIFTLVNEYITPVTGKVSSLFMISACLGASVNPVMLGNIMERYGDIWLCYGFVTEGFLIVLLYVVLLGLTKNAVKRFGKTFDKTRTVENSTSLRETFINGGNSPNECQSRNSTVDNNN